MFHCQLKSYNGGVVMKLLGGGVMEKEYYNALSLYINEIRSIRHDMQAHFIVLQYFLDSEKYDKAKAYLDDMKIHQPRHQMVFKDTGNDLVNAIVSDILGRSSKKILFELEGLLPTDFVMTEYDICTLFSNLFSNAKEACEKLDVEEPRISMQVIDGKEECQIVLQNPIEWKVQINEAGLVSSKKDKSSHGFGTKNILKVIKSYKGRVEYLITDSSFRVDIILPNK